ncbi:MAG: response regulator [Candidatus Binatia bacterium]
MSAKNSILIVEGSRTQAERLRLVLQAHNYLVSVLTDGGEALAVARTQQPALIISGVALSGMDGYELCAALKQDHEVKHIPVVLLTAVTDVEDLLRGLRARVDYYIAKPYQEEELVSRISSIMDGLVRGVGQSESEQLEVLVRGERKTLSPDRLQLLRLLVSTYENYSAALRQNRSLSTSHLQLKTQNQHLREEYERLQVVLQKFPAPSEPSSSPNAPARTTEAESVHRILVAEDTIICRTLLARFLEKLGCHADVVANGNDAIAAYQKQNYAAVLMDIHMPEVGGFEAVARIRQYEKASGGHIPIIAITAQGDPGDRERCLAAGMDDYLAKPVTLAALKGVLEARLSRWTLSAGGISSVAVREGV